MSTNYVQEAEIILKYSKLLYFQIDGLNKIGQFCIDMLTMHPSTLHTIVITLFY